MSDPKQPNTTAAAPAKDISVRIGELRDEVDALEKEIRSLLGKLTNRDASIKDRLIQENTRLRTKVTQLEKALFALISERYRPRDLNEAKQQAEVFRLSAIQYFNHAKIDPGIWKKIES